jgi:hypothetical protein
MRFDRLMEHLVAIFALIVLIGGALIVVSPFCHRVDMGRDPHLQYLVPVSAPDPGTGRAARLEHVADGVDDAAEGARSPS